ncbi:MULTISPECIES: DegT/DnrJ/EryC1/StrS family aminotransferase [Dethiosulfovibrio]|uniref:DegT/DnrJ/EryC1/StrS family aminotransferase n=2 Tax=Dethiosulfovibrio TaxID=47054 RepID=A0ABS9ENZ2_9BACT|nr:MULTISPECIES: DegT/DnrJ/EryC1/StrS family aminotransferase [Dethiosulfovibrio]MCF4114667.1 DegT/DnrJ/EryC1/StrS family aminotransferase [Dethiosulfovibrio russensis]MCF4142890.1 DegT/DnrJ/EryC1/StrS family aminotransferase [Dethiosulfovibrio marinus]MCF4144781.1 DegT/DnrJ/EryC1/StrS family aminotransferase [Dethiosulfovibrio acidaminovorans]
MKDRKLPTLDLKRGYARIKDEIDQAVKEVLESQYFIMGPQVSGLESDVERYLEVPRAIGCASGSDALVLALKALDLKPGDEVITTPYSFFATASCITRLGATPVFADVDPDSYNVTAETVLSKVTDKTKAFIPVHLFGQMVHMEELSKELEARNVAIVEDCAQAFGSWRSIDGAPVRAGAFGVLGCFSFFPTKNLGGYGDGGMVVSRDQQMADRIAKLRVHGAGTTYFHDEVGINSRLDAIQAAVLRVKLRHLDSWNEERRIAADRYRVLFAEHDLLGIVTPPGEDEGNYHIYHQYVPKVIRDRDRLLEHLGSEGITARVYYPLSLHMQRCFSFLGYDKGDFPVSESLTEQTIALPIFPEITEEEQEWVVSTIAAFYGKK